MSQKKETSNPKSVEDRLKMGYAEMAEINTQLSEEGAAADSEALMCYEEKLMESE